MRRAISLALIFSRPNDRGFRDSVLIGTAGQAVLYPFGCSALGLYAARSAVREALAANGTKATATSAIPDPSQKAAAGPFRSQTIPAAALARMVAKPDA